MNWVRLILPCVLVFGCLQAEDLPPLPPEKPAEPEVKPQPAAATVDPATLGTGQKIPSSRYNEEEDDPTLDRKDPLDSAEIHIGRKDQNTPPAPPPPALPCPTCGNRGHLPSHRRAQTLILLETDAAPDPETALGWTPCPDCKHGLESKDRFEAEKARLAGRAAAYAAHEKSAGAAFLDFETRHLTGHFQATPAEVRECARQLEKLTGILREHSGETWLKASPAAQHMVLCENERAYAAYLDLVVRKKTVAEDHPNWQQLARTTSSFGSRNLTVLRRDTLVAARGADGLGHTAVFVFAQMLAHEAADGKAPIWFCEGFSSQCEYLVFQSQWCYSIRYEQNKLSLDANWAEAVARGLRENKVRAWEIIFTRELIGMPVIEYQQCWSMVRYLYQLNAEAFGQLPGHFRAGLDATKALEKAYGKPVAQLEAAWRTWAAQGR